MANYDRKTTLSRLSKLQQEIQKLTDSLSSPKSLSTSSTYGNKAASEPTPRYTSELEAKYLGKGFDRSKNISTSRDTKEQSKTSGTNPSRSYDRWASAGSDKPSGLASTSYTYYSAKASSGKKSSTSNQSGYTSRESGQYSAAKSPSLDGLAQGRSFRQSSFLSVPEESFPIQRSTSSQGYPSWSSRLKEIEDKYLLSNCSSSTWQMNLKPSVHSSLSETPNSSTTRSLSASDPPSKSWGHPGFKDPSHRLTHLIKPTSPTSSHLPKGNSSKYSWRPSPASKSDDVSRSLFRSNTTPASRSRSSETERHSSTSRHHSLDTNRSKYQFESSKTPSSSSRKHGHDSHHHRSSTSHSSRYTYTSTPSTNKPSQTHRTSHATTRTKPAPNPSSSLHKSTRYHEPVAARSHGFLSRTGLTYVRSRGRGFANSRGRGSPFSRGLLYSASRGRGAVTFRGRGAVAFRGRGAVAFRGRGAVTFRGRGTVNFRGRGGRGYRSTIFKDYESGSSRGRGFYRGQGPLGQRTEVARGWRLPHRSSEDGKGTSSSSKMSTKGSYSSRYALRKSHGSSVYKKPLSFMERRRQTVLNNTPVLPRSKYNLVKGHRSAVRPESSTVSLSRSSRRMSDVKRFVTVKNTKTKLIRRAEGDRRPSGSLVHPGGSPFKLSIYPYRKALHRIHPSTHSAPSGHPTSTPSTSKRRAETLSHSSRHSHRLAFKSSTSVTRKVASHVLRRSIHASLAARERTKKQSQSKQYCMFYNLYGRCRRGNACPYIHDPDKVAVCTRFLRGTCPKTDGSCLFSHKVSKDKMPVCSYFLRGVCNRDNCPYSHVKVNSKATPCAAFIKGHCPLRERCKKQHILRCAQFSKTGKCDREKACPLLHKKDAAVAESSSRSKPKTKKASKRSQQTYPTDTRTPSKRAKQSDGNSNTPSFIKLSTDSLPEKTAPSKSGKGETADNAPSVTTSGEVPGIIPSFVKLSSLEKAREIASTSEHKNTTKAKKNSMNTSNDPSSDVGTPYNQNDCLELFDDTPISNILFQEGPVTELLGNDTHSQDPAKPAWKAKKVTVTSLSPNGMGSTTGSMPSYIELSVGDTPADQMEDLAHAAQQGELWLTEDSIIDTPRGVTSVAEIENILC